MLALRDAREAHDVLAIVARSVGRDFRRPCTAYEYRDNAFRAVATSDPSIERSAIRTTELDVPSLRFRVLLRNGSDDLLGISSDGQLRALIVLENAVEPLGEEDAKYLRAIAAHVSLALANALAFEQLRRYAAEGAALTEAARTILGFTALEPLALALCSLCKRLVVAERACLYARRGDVFARIAILVSRDGLEAPAELPGDETAARAALVDAFGDGPLAIARLVFPEGDRLETRGLIVCSRRVPFDKSEARLIETFATLAALAVRNVDLYEQSTRANQALAESNAFKDDLMAMFAHDFKGPLTVISGFSELLFDVEDESVQRSAETIVEQTRRLARLSEDALALAATQSAGFSLKRVEEDLTAFVCAAAEPLDRERDRIAVEAPFEPVIVPFDRLRLRHVIDNVLGNALKYSAGRVHVRIESDGLEAAISVSDSGIGIPRDDLEKIFSRFGRAANARSRGIAGSGVGLYVSKKIVDVHGGRIEVVSTEDQGSTFRIVLPLEVGAAMAPVEIGAVNPTLESGAGKPGATKPAVEVAVAPRRSRTRS
jgi:signal transduction histidine kinase